jgi:hypothetical protein
MAGIIICLLAAVIVAVILIAANIHSSRRQRLQEEEQAVLQAPENLQPEADQEPREVPVTLKRAAVDEPDRMEDHAYRQALQSFKKDKENKSPDGRMDDQTFRGALRSLKQNKED